MRVKTLVLPALLAAALAGAVAPLPGPGGYRGAVAAESLAGLTEEVVRREVEAMFTAVYHESWMKPGDLRFEYEGMEILPESERKMDRGEYAKPVPVRPVRMTVRVVVNRGGTPDVKVRGRGNPISPKETFYFYRQDGEWTFKTGSP